MITHANIFGKESYIVVAIYNTSPHDEIIIGHFTEYNRALEYMVTIKKYKNVLGDTLFSGGKIYAVPENPISYDSDYWNYLRIER